MRCWRRGRGRGRNCGSGARGRSKGACLDVAEVGTYSYVEIAGSS
jgi:hypothetical protein